MGNLCRQEMQVTNIPTKWKVIVTAKTLKKNVIYISWRISLPNIYEGHRVASYVKLSVWHLLQWIPYSRGVLYRAPNINTLFALSVLKYSGMLNERSFPGKGCDLIDIVGTHGCVFIDNETHESGVTKCTTGEAWNAFSWHHSSMFHCQWTHNQVFLLLSHMLI